MLPGTQSGSGSGTGLRNCGLLATNLLCGLGKVTSLSLSGHPAFCLTHLFRLEVLWARDCLSLGVWAASSTVELPSQRGDRVAAGILSIIIVLPLQDTQRRSLGDKGCLPLMLGLSAPHCLPPMDAEGCVKPTGIKWSPFKSEFPSTLPPVFHNNAGSFLCAIDSWLFLSNLIGSKGPRVEAVQLF